MADRFLARKISDVDKGIIEGCEEVADTKYILSFSHLWSKPNDLFFLLFLPLAKCHVLPPQASP
jgi:hypothetical protein